MTESTKRTADIFSAARTLYTRRKALLEKADKLFEEAEPRVRAICEAIEEEEAGQRPSVAPSSPDSTPTSG